MLQLGQGQVIVMRPALMSAIFPGVYWRQVKWAHFLQAPWHCTPVLLVTDWRQILQAFFTLVHDFILSVVVLYPTLEGRGMVRY